MRMADDELQEYRARWARLFPEVRHVDFDGFVVTNDYCPDCRYCCGPQKESEPFPMALLDRQISGRTPDDFYLLDSHTACLDQRGCKALGPAGCRLERTLRPVACALFPFVLVNLRLYLYLICPASMFVDKAALLDMGGRVHVFLSSLDSADRARISISRRPEDLKAKYLDLGLPDFA